MSEEREFRDHLKAMTPQQFLAEYLALREEQWNCMSRGLLRAWNDQLVFNGMVTQVEDAIGEVVTPSARHLTQRYGVRASSSQPTTDGSEKLTAEPLPSASTDAGEPSNEPVRAAVVGPGRVIAQPSIGVSSGAPRDVESGYEIVAYRRLPLPGKRDAFVAEGFLYVRNKTLRDWFEHLCLGKCCPAQRDGAAHHSTGCWLDAVR